ncbi:O-glycosyl hydrolase [Paenibacillus endophyticus]|uniref:O-glycosyl hydrolase n=1 Tax=Paenibacillus endophyticus TaxID=1294268 RepID=A0A7W5C548_9BACL|nr:O-glycosyl hydrolase [Paenibacillus endophyticus]
MEQKRIQWLSSIEEDRWEDKSAKIAADTEIGKPNLTVTEDQYQWLEGFGGCFNELGYVSLKHLTDEERGKVMFDLFHPEGEQGFSICRLPIGASDYALEWYSLNESDGDLSMEHFSIDRDREYLIPYI